MLNKRVNFVVFLISITLIVCFFLKPTQNNKVKIIYASNLQSSKDSYTNLKPLIYQYDADFNNEIPNKFSIEFLYRTNLTKDKLANVPTRIPLITHSNDYLYDALKGTHVWEADNTEVLENLFYRIQKEHLSTSKTSPYCYIDIGCNIGIFTLLAATRRVPTVCIDMQISNIKRVAMSSALNGIAKNMILLLHTAVSNKRGKLNYFVERKQNAVAKSFEIKKSVFKYEKETRFKVPEVHFDDLLDLIKYHPSLDSKNGVCKTLIVKMDIEGAEYRALQKADKIFQSFHIPMVMMEWQIETHVSKDKEFLKLVAKNMTDFFKQRSFSPYGSRNDYKNGKPLTTDSIQWNMLMLLWIKDNDMWIKNYI